MDIDDKYGLKNSLLMFFDILDNDIGYQALHPRIFEILNFLKIEIFEILKILKF